MSRRGINMKMSRKTKPVESNSTSNGITTRVLRPNKNVPSELVHTSVVPSQKIVVEKSKRKKLIKVISKTIISNDIPHSEVHVEPELNFSNTNEEQKTRRRRPDAGNYIKRRFLYSDESQNRKVQDNLVSPAKPDILRNSRFQNCSTAALMAASSANLLQKRRMKRISSAVSSSKKAPKKINCCTSKLKSHCSQDSYDTANLSIDFDPRNNDEASDTDKQTFSDSDASLPLSYRQQKNQYSSYDEYLNEKEYIPKPLFQKQARAYPHNHLDTTYSSDEINTSNDPRFSPFSEFMLDDNVPGLLREGESHISTNKSRHTLDSRQFRRVRGDKSALYGRKNYDDLENSSSDDEFPLRTGVSSNLPISESIDNGLQLAQSAQEMCRKSSEVSLETRQTVFSSQTSGVVDVDDFAGDLLPQRIATVPATGSSRRKSPIRPMQVVRTEPTYYDDQNLEHVQNVSRSYVEEDMDQRYCTEDSIALKEQSSCPPHLYQSCDNTLHSFSDLQPRTGLVDLCAAANDELADLHSTNEAYSLLPSSPISTYPDLGDHSITSDQDHISPIAQIPNSNMIKKISIPSGHLYVDSTSAGIRQEMPTYFLPTKSTSNLKYSQNSYSYVAPTSSKMTSNAGSSSSCMKTSNSSRRRPSILKRVFCNTAAVSSIAIRSQNPPVVSLVQSSGAPRFQPPFLRTIGSFTPVSASGGVHNISLVTGANFDSKSLTSSVATGSGQILRLISPNSGKASLAYAVVSCSANTASSTQTASSRLFGRRNYSGDTGLPIAFIQNQKNCMTPLIASPIRYTVVRGASDGKKYVFLGSPPNALSQTSDISENRIENSVAQEITHPSDETTDAVEFVASWNSAASTTETSSIDLAKSSSSHNLSEFATVS